MNRSKKSKKTTSDSDFSYKCYSTVINMGNKTPEELEARIKTNIDKLAKEKGFKKSDLKDVSVKIVPNKSTPHLYIPINSSPEFMTDNYTFRNKTFVPFEIVIPSEFEELYCFISEKDYSKEEYGFIKSFVTVMTKETYIDIYRIAEKAQAYLELTSSFVYSFHRCESYYKILEMITSRLDVLCFTTKMLKYRMFNIPIPNDGTIQSIYYSKYMGDIVSIENMYNDFISKDNLNLLKCSEDIYTKYPFIILDGFEKLIENMIKFKDILDVGLRLALEYRLGRSSEFCSKECCLMPEKMRI